MAGYICPAKVVGVSVNTSALSERDAQKEVRAVEEQLQLPATDPYRFGVENLVDAILKERDTSQSTNE